MRRHQNTRRIPAGADLVLQIDTIHIHVDQVRRYQHALPIQGVLHRFHRAASQLREKIKQHRGRRPLRTLGNHSIETLMVIQEYRETENCLFDQAQIEQLSQHLQVTQQRQVWIQRHCRQLGPLLLKRRGELPFQQFPSAATTRAIFVLLRLVFGESLQADHHQETTVFPQGIMVWVAVRKGTMPVQHQRQVDQPATQQRLIGSRLFILQQLRGRTGLEKPGQIHRAHSWG